MFFRFLKGDLLWNEVFITFEKCQCLRYLKTVGLGVHLFCTSMPLNLTLFNSKTLSFYSVEFTLFSESSMNYVRKAGGVKPWSGSAPRGGCCASSLIFHDGDQISVEQRTYQLCV